MQRDHCAPNPALEPEAERQTWRELVDAALGGALSATGITLEHVLDRLEAPR